MTLDLTERERRLLGYLVTYLDQELAGDDTHKSMIGVDCLSGVYSAMMVYGFNPDAAETTITKLRSVFHLSMDLAREKAIMPRKEKTT